MVEPKSIANKVIVVVNGMYSAFAVALVVSFCWEPAEAFAVDATC